METKHFNPTCVKCSQEMFYWQKGECFCLQLNLKHLHLGHFATKKNPDGTITWWRLDKMVKRNLIWSSSICPKDWLFIGSKAKC